VRSGGPRGYCPSNLADDVPPAAQQSRGGAAAEGRGRGRGHNTGARSGRVEGFQRRVEHGKVRYREAVRTTTPTRRQAKRAAAGALIRAGGVTCKARHIPSDQPLYSIEPCIASALAAAIPTTQKSSTRSAESTSSIPAHAYSHKRMSTLLGLSTLLHFSSSAGSSPFSRTKQLIRNCPRYLVTC
jgi:hypothetical protein